MTEKIQQKYIAAAIKDKTLPDNAYRIPDIVALNAPKDQSKPIQFWQTKLSTYDLFLTSRVSRKSEIQSRALPKVAKIEST